VLVGIVLPSGESEARPVRIGRYTEIPYGVPSEPWPTGGGGPRRAGRSGATAPREEPSRLFEARLGGGRPSSPLVTEHGLFVASASGVSYLALGGEIRWTTRLGFVSGTPSLTPTGDVVVGTNAGALVTLGVDGRALERTLVGGAVKSSPLVLDDGSIVVGAYDQAAHRFDSDGRRIFRAVLPFQPTSAPAWTPRGDILVANGDRLIALDTRGAVRTTTSLGATVAAGPAVAEDGTAWVLTQDGALHQVTPDGNVRTRTDLELAISPTAEIAIGRDGGVRIATRDDALVCVGPTGTERWRVAGEGGFLGGVVLDREDVAIAVTEVGKLLAIDALGNVLYRVDTNARADQSPVLGHDGTIYVATVRGTVQAWR
jgi:outer membrane protein assembly factor BamB